MAARSVIVDTDPAIGCAMRDVDDGLALLYLLSPPGEPGVLGVTSVHGNASIEVTTEKAAEVLRVARRPDLPLRRGAKSRGRLGSETDASRFLSETAGARPGEVTVLALGPLTNLATAGLKDRSFYGNLERIVMMGGALDEGFGIPLLSPLEFNFFKDPVAAEEVLGAPCEKVVITADLCRQVVFTRQELDSLWRMENRAATYLAYRIEPWLRLNQVAPVPWKGGFVPWDVIAAVYLRRPELFHDAGQRGMRLRRGRFITGALEDDPGRADLPATVPMGVDGEAVLDDFLDAVDRYGNRRPSATGPEGSNAP